MAGSRNRSIARLFAGILVLGMTRPAWAGMSPNPVTFDVDRIVRYRIEAMSFFAVLTLALAGLVMVLWNMLRREFPRLPRLSYARSLGLVLLWGLLIAVVLSMTTAARELMTPGAWERAGAGYRLTGGEVQPNGLDVRVRQQKLETLKTALWNYANKHGGEFPTHEWVEEIPSDDWNTPHPSQQRYVYVPGRRLVETDAVTLVYEPDIFGDDRFTLMNDGEIRRLNSGELADQFRGPYKGVKK